MNQNLRMVKKKNLFVKKLHAKSQQDKNHLYRPPFVIYHLVCAPIDHYVCHVCKMASLSSSQ